jgi:eukaryotic-like serine/threonine-protein kinase
MTDVMTRLGAALMDRYVIERELGAGGMATVYLAHDVRHDRKVALKVLRPELSAILGGARFLTEIKTTANLQHPHILQLFDSGEADGTVFYVMPYVEGESLRDRLVREKQLPVDEAVRIAREVADALEYAHQHKIVHRDIKPENILLHGGHALVADFGIALAASRSDGGTRMTETGMSLGTPHYMSPEQAMGEREITPRADIYALGCVLYEMLTGEPPFTGPTAQAIIARVMTEQPRSLTLQRHTIPPHVEAVVRKALEKLPADRFASARELADALGNAAFAGFAATPTAATPSVRPAVRRSFVAAMVVPWLLLAAVGAWAVRLVRQRPPEQVGRYALALDSAVEPFYVGGGTPARIALSPDGGTVVYLSNSFRPQLLARNLDQLEPRTITAAVAAFFPAVSPDGGQVAFLAVRSGRASLEVASLQGGPTLTLTTVGNFSTPAWGPGGFVYYVDSGSVRRIPASGGTPETVVALPPLGQGSTYRDLVLLPSGRGALLTEFGPNRPDDARLHVTDLSTGRASVTLQGGWGRFVPEADALVYVGPDGTLMAAPFDEGALALEGRPTGVFGGIAARFGGMDLAIGGRTLAYMRPGVNATERIVWVNRAAGRETPVDPSWQDIEYEAFALSPDGRRLAIAIGDPAGRRYDIWIKQLDQGPLSRLTFGGSANDAPAWTADGRYVSYVSTRDGRRSLWRRRADGVGVEELVAETERNVHDAFWSRDGNWLVVSATGGETGRDLLAMRLGTDSTLRPLLAEPHDEFKGRVSPDGRWLAYVSTETGQPQVFVRPFPDAQQGKWQISTQGGNDPAWSANGRELFFRALDGQAVFVTDLSRGPAAAAPTVAVEASAASRRELNGWDQLFSVSSDGRRFLFSTTASGDATGELVIVQNFVAELRAALEGSR